MNNSFEQNLREWGRGQWKLPPGASLLRAQAIAHMVPASELSMRKSLWWLAPLITMGAAVFVFVFTADPNTRTLTSGSSIFSQRMHGAPALSLDAQQSQDAASSLQEEQGIVSAPPQAFSKSAIVEDAPQSNMILPPQSQTDPLPISDGREFLKTSYAASVAAREVEKVGGRLLVLVRGFGGRVDSSSLGSEFGSISFVLPKDKLESLRAQIKETAGERFVIETTESQNLLSQKQALEQQQADLEKQRARIKVQSQELLASHDKAVANINAQLLRNRAEQKRVLAEERAHPEQVTVLEAQLATLRQTEHSLARQLAGEQASFVASQKDYNAQLDAIQQSLATTTEDTSKLLDDVETIAGHIQFTRISFFEFADAYLYFHWSVPFTLVLLGLALWFWRSKFVAV